MQKQEQARLTLEELNAIESEGRKRAFNRDDLPIGDGYFLEKMANASEQIAWDTEIENPDLYDLAFSIAEAARYGIEDANKCESVSVPRKNCEVSYETKIMLYNVDDKSEKAIGRRCTYLLGQIDFYSLSAFLNDITACFHTALDLYKSTRDEWVRMGKCIWKVV